MKRFNKAFTLTELLVALGVIAVVCAILLPVVFNLMPNQNTIMAKRAYYTISSVVSELINDPACYPDKTSGSASETRVGFDDAAGYANCSKWDYTGHGNDNTNALATKKFQTLFTDKLGVALSEDNTFQTTDGMNWAFDSTTSFDKGDTNGEGGSVTLMVDVNGIGSEPNCSGNTTTFQIGSSDTATNDACKDRTKGYDRFSVVIKGNGLISINEDWAKNAVTVDRNITGDGTSNDNDAN